MFKSTYYIINEIKSKFVIGNTYLISVLFLKFINFFLNISIANSAGIELFGEYSKYIYYSNYLLLLTNFGYHEYILVHSKNILELKTILSHFILYSILTFVSIVLLSGIYFAFDILFVLVITRLFINTQLDLIILTYYQFCNKLFNFGKNNLGIVLINAITIAIYTFLLNNIYVLLIILLLVNIFFFITRSHEIFQSSSEYVNIIKNKIIFSKDFIYFGLNAISIPFYMQMPLFISTFLISKENIGLLNIGISITSLLFVYSTVEIQKMIPKLMVIEDTLVIKRMVLKGIKKIIYMNVVAIIIILILSKYIITKILFDPIFENTTNIILILTIANILQSISSILVTLIIKNKMQKNKFKMQFEYIIVGAIFSLLLGNIYGVIGIAFSLILLYLYVISRTYIFIKTRSLF